MDKQLRYAIALTVSIGIGKSTFVSLLSLYGNKSSCADSIAHKVLEEHSAEVIAYFGNEILQSDNTINRKVLGNIIFASSSKREELQAILHPHIQKAILTKHSSLKKRKYGIL